MHKYNTEAIVLRNINYQDANKIYTLLTKDNGKITAVGRGVRKLSSRRSGNLDTLNYVRIHISEDAKGYKTIQEAKSLQSFKAVKDSLDLSVNALYFAELVSIFVNEENESHQVFNLLLKSLHLLNTADLMPVYVTGMFELKLLSLLGFELTLDRCVSCSKPLSEEWGTYGFSYDFGGIYCHDCSVAGFALDMNTALALFTLGKASISLDKTLDFTPFDSVDVTKALNIVKTHLESIAANYHKQPKVRKMLKKLE